jgi:hypothetical protein
MLLSIAILFLSLGVFINTLMTNDLKKRVEKLEKKGRLKNVD